MVRQFVTQMPGQLKGLREALERGDAESLRQRSHRLKGAASNLRADSIMNAAQCLEEVGRQGNLDAGPEALTVLEDRVARLKDYLPQTDWYRFGS